jgi:membrane protease YdiL (CAAX protease family)
MTAPRPDSYSASEGALAAPVDLAAPQPRWGMPDAGAAWFLAQVFGAIGALIVLTAAGYETATEVKDLPLWVLALQYPALWLGFIGVPVWAAATKGRGIVEDFRLRIEAIDLPVGAVVGFLAQVIVVPLVSLPILWAFDIDADKLGEPARQLGDKATSPGGVVLLFLMVAVGAPIAEEIFFRGLLLRSIEKRFGTAIGVAGSSVAFGATHFQALQFLPLALVGAIFALLVVRTGRLGTAIVAHMAFNATTVAFLVWS